MTDSNLDRLIDEFVTENNKEDLRTLAQLIVSECSSVLQIHAAQLSRYNFYDKANTAAACSKIILEHFKQD